MAPTETWQHLPRKPLERRRRPPPQLILIGKAHGHLATGVEPLEIHVRRPSRTGTRRRAVLTLWRG